MYQDTFDHDKRQKSAISGKFLHWRINSPLISVERVFRVAVFGYCPQGSVSPEVIGGDGLTIT